MQKFAMLKKTDFGTVIQSKEYFERTQHSKSAVRLNNEEHWLIRINARTSKSVSEFFNNSLSTLIQT